MKEPEVQHEIEINEHRLFLDLSSACSGYAVARIKKGKTQFLQDATCEIVRAGAIWFPSSWTNDQKYYYMYRLVCEDFYVTSAVNDVIYERYSFNSNQAQGSLVVPEMIGAIKVAAHDVDAMPLGVEDITPQTWRKQVGIKAIKTPQFDKDGKPVLTKSGKQKMSQDWKTPCVNHFKEMFGDKIPDQIISNATGKLRNTPHDTFDALGVCVGWHKRLGVKKFDIRKNAFNIQVMMDL